jgi:cytochrome c553
MRMAVLAVCLAASLPALADMPPPGASTCSGCHGGGGMVSITGRDPVEMTEMLAAFRSGARPSTLMGRLVKGFSPAELDAIARYLAVQK